MSGFKLTLNQLPLIAAGFHAIEADSCGRLKRWYIDRYAEVPDKWTNWFMSVERTLGRFAGRTVAEVFTSIRGGAKYPEWVGPDRECQYPDQAPAIGWIYYSVDDSPGDIMRAAGVPSNDIEKVQHLFNEFFDGNEEHEELRRLFITDQYSI